MSLVPVTDREAVAAAFASISAQMGAGAAEFPAAEIGWPGGAGRLAVRWRRGERLWLHAGPPADRGHHLLLFGTEHPGKAARLAITCEINAPAEGVNRKCAGAILRDACGGLYLAHSGRCGGVGGGLGLFRTAFTGANWHLVSWPGEAPSEMHVIARIDGPRLAAQIAYFVHEIARIKIGRRRGGADDALIAALRFRPELARAKRPRRRADPLEASCDRGLVVAALFDALSARAAVEAGPALVARERGGRARFAFAVGTDRSPSALRLLVGDLALHAGALRPAPKPFAVLPAPIGDALRATLAAAGIAIVPYAWSKGWPVFALPRDLA